MTRRLYLVLALAALTLILGLGNGFPLFYRLFLLMVVVLVGSLIWAYLNLTSVHVRAQRVRGRLQVGDSLETRVTISNSGLLPKFGLEVRDLLGLPENSPGQVTNLWPGQMRRWVWKVPLRKRGVYRLATPTVFSTDPFGIFRLQRRGGHSEELVVFPRLVELPFFTVPEGEWAGEGAIERGLQADTISASSIREHQPGESFRHIHWPSTARTGRLMLKNLYAGLEDRAWIVLDLHRRVQVGEEIENTEEHSVAAAASIARRYLAMGWAVGLVAQGDQSYSLPQQAGTVALERLLAVLARARAEGDLPLTTLLTTLEGQWATSPAALVVVTASTDPRWVQAMASWTQQGISVTAVVVDPHSFGAPGEIAPFLGLLQGRGVTTYLFRRDDDLPQALSRPLARVSSG